MHAESLQETLYLLLVGVAVGAFLGSALLILRLSWHPIRQQNPVVVRRIIVLVGCLAGVASMASCLIFYIDTPRSVFPPEWLAVGLMLSVIIGLSFVVRLRAIQALQSWVERLANQIKKANKHDDTP